MDLFDDDNSFERVVLPLFEEHRREWVSRARATAAALGANGRVITINDVRKLCPPNIGDDPRVMGAVFTRSKWQCLGHVRSERGTCHKRPIGQFKMKAGPWS